MISILVQNQTRSDADITVAVRDMVAGDGVESTAFEYMPVGEAPRGAGAWLRVREAELHVPAGTEQQIELELRVPKGAGAGGHYAAVELVASDPTPPRGEVVIDYATHVPVLLTVAGELERDLQLTVEPRDRWRFTGGTARWTVRMHNRGDVHEIVSGRMRVDGLIGGATSAPLRGGVLLPGEQRSQDVEVALRAAPDLWAARVRVELDDADAASADAARVLVLPWWLLVLIAAAVIVVAWRVRKRRSGGWE